MRWFRSAALATACCVLAAGCGSGGEEQAGAPSPAAGASPSALAAAPTSGATAPGDAGQRGTAQPTEAATDGITPEPTAEATAPRGGDATVTGDSTGASARVEARVLASNLESPWGLAFLPGGDALVSERDSGRLLRVSPDGEVRQVQRLPEEGEGEGGFLGIALSPDYAEDGLVYAYLTTAEDNRVVRFRLGEEPEPVLTGIPAATYHNGGRLAFGPDGMLYVTTGDAGDGAASQNRESLGGKILRLMPDGAAPGDNPLDGSPVYSLGHRNVQGLAWDAEGRLYAPEFGQDTWDEVNRIVPGGNYGWPEVEGEGGDDRYRDPITTWPTSDASPSGAAILRDGAIPQWEGDLFVAALRGERLWRLELDGEGNLARREALYEGEYGRIRTVAQAPDGSLWLMTSNHDSYGEPGPQDDRIVRLGPGAAGGG